MKKITVLLFLLLLSFSNFSQAVVINGREWIQPADVTGFSYIDISATCNFMTGSCNGILGSVDVTGYTWASRGDVIDLFQNFVPTFNGGLFQEFNTFWGLDFLNTFTPTSFNTLVWGVARTQTMYTDFVLADQGFVTFFLVSDNPTPNLNQMLVGDALREGGFVELEDRSARRGAWLFRDVAAVDVPEPSTYLLLLFGLIGVAYTRRAMLR